MANKTFGNKAKGAVKSFLEQTASMFNPDPKGTPSGDVDITKMIEKTLAASIGAVMFGKKSGVEDYNALKGQLSKKSFLEQINDGMKGITSGMQGIRDVTKNISNMLSDLSGPIKSIDLLMNETMVEHIETLDLLKQISDTAYGKLDLILSRFDNLETYAELSIDGINLQTEELRNIRGDISTLFDAVLESGKSEGTGGENILNFVLSTDGSTSMEELSNALVSINDVDSEKIGSLVEKLGELNQIKLDNIPNITEGLTSFNESFSAISQSIGSIANDGSLMENLQSATEKFSAIKNFFDNDIAQAAASVAGGQDKVKQITDGIQKTSEDMDNASSSIDSNSQVNIQASFEGLGKTILLAGATMLLGGWILSKNPQLIVESLKFGAVLTVFITMTMAPMLMLKVFNKDAQDIGPILDTFGNFIIKATFVMLLGGLIFMIGGGKIIKNAMKFGVEFAKFILLCSLAMIPMKALQGVDVNSVATFVVKATLIMMLGALFVMLGGGEIMKNALQFGVVLGLFIFIVLLPFRLLGGLFGSALKAADEVARLIVTTTIIMMLGALFLMLGGGKIATMALAYGIVLGLFIFLVMLPFKLLFGRGSFKLALDIKLFQNFLITTTILLMVGALFMTLKGGEYAINAIKFGGLLMLFTIGILLPFIILKQPLKQAWSTIIAITALILVEAVVLMLGVQLVEQGLVWEAIGFTVLFAAFLIGTIAPFVLLQSTITEVWPSVLAFAALVAVTGLTITLLTATIEEYGFGAVLEAAVTLVTTVAILTACFIVLGAILGEMTMGMATAGAMAVIIGTIALSLVLLMIAQQKGNMLVAAIILVGVMGLLVVMFTLLSIISPYISIGLGVSLGIAAVLLAISGSFLILAIATKLSNPLVNFLLLIGVLYVAVAAFTLLGLLIVPLALGSVAAMLMSAALMTLSAAFLMLHVCVAGKVPPTEDLNSLMSALVIAGVVFSFLGVLIVPIVLGSVAAVAMSVAFTTLSIAFLMLRLAIGDGTIFEDLKALNKVLVIAGLVFTLLGVLSVPIVLGSAAAVAMSVAFTTLGLAFLALRLGIGDGTVLQDMKTLNKVLVIAGLVFSLLGVLLVPITLALVSTGMMCTSLIMLSNALRIVGKLNADYKDLPKTLKTVFTGSDASIPQLKKMFTSLASPFLLLKVIAARKTMKNMAYAIADIAYAYGQMGKAQKLIKEGFGDDSSKIFEKITNILKAMPDAFMKLKEDDNFGKLDGKTLREIEFKNWYMSRVVSRTANVLGHMAHYSVLEMTEDGKWKTVVVKPEDMINAATAINTILTTLAKAVWESSLWIKGIDFDDLEDFLDLSDEMGDMVEAMAEGIKNYAEMMIPVYRGGKIVKKRPMNEQDFTNASEGIAKVMTTVVCAVGKLAAEGITINGKHKDWEDVEDDLSVVIDCACHIGDIISNIADGIKNYADLKIPTGFDEGKATGYRKIKDKDFQKAGENTSTIMTTMINALSDTYYRNKSMFEDAEEGFLFFKKKKENSSPIAKIIGIAVQISELIGNTAEGVAKMAALQIATDWDKNGKPIKFYTLQPSDFKKSGETVDQIMSSMLTSLSNSYYRNIGLYNNNDAVNNVIKMAQSIGGIIGGIANGVQKMAAGKVAINWDPKTGKPTEFRSLTTDDFDNAGLWTGKILTATANAIGNVYYQGWEYDPKTGRMKRGPVNPLFDGDSEDAPIMVAVKGVQKFGTIISNVASGVEALANLKVAKKWNKEGKPIEFDKLNLDDIIGNNGKLHKVLAPVLSATANAIGSVYYKDWKVDKDGKISHGEVNDLFKTPRGGFLSSGDAPIVAAVEGLTEIFDLVKNVIEVVQNIALLKMPVGPFDKDGKPKGYETMSKDDIENKLEPNLKAIMTALPRAIKNVYDDGVGQNWWTEATQEQLENMQGIYNNIAGIVTAASKVLTAYGNLKAPVLDKKGNIKSYMDVSKIVKDIDTVKTNITKILTSLPDALQEAISHGALTTLETINKNEGTFESGYDNIANIVASIGESVDEVVRQSEIFKDKDISAEIKKIETASVSFMNIAESIVNSNMLKPHMAKRFVEGLPKFMDLTDDVARISLRVCAVVAAMQKSIHTKGNALSPISMWFTFKTYTDMFRKLDKFVYFLNGDKKNNVIEDLLGIKEKQDTGWRGLDGVKVKFDVKRFKRNVLDNVAELIRSLALFSVKFNAINYFALVRTYRTFDARQFYILGLLDKLAIFTKEINTKMDIVKRVKLKHVIRMRNINTLFTTIGQTFNKINEISGNLEGYDFKKDVWETKLQDLNELQSKLYNAFTLTGDGNFNHGLIGLRILQTEAKFFELKAQTLLNTTKAMALVSAYAATTNPEGIDNVTESIDQLDESLRNIEWETIDKFEVENKNLKNYVKTINKVDVSKVDSMSNLFGRLEAFMYSVGDLPKFTEALADKLATGLNGVASETRIAAKVIKDAERIQKARQENIKKAVKDVETLMGKKLQIEVSRADDGNSLSGNYTGDSPADTQETSVKQDAGRGDTGKR